MSFANEDAVKAYYGQELQSSADLKTSACCPVDAMPRHLARLLDNVHPVVRERFYGCGSPIPPLLEGARVLDLGCGSGRDSFLLSQLVGPEGEVVGVDMTDEQLHVAKHHVAWHMDRFGYTVPNVHFLKGYIEDLAALGLEDASFDVVVSNCVINLSSDKERVFSEIFRVLKPGGELLFSDIFAGRRIPEALTRDRVLVGECLGGALYTEDFRRLMRRIGCLDYRILSRSPVTLEDEEIRKKAGMIDFYSMTIRAFRLPLEDICENYGQVAWYKGTIPEHPHEFALDDHHLFRTGLPLPVCGNTAMMLEDTRYRPHFRVAGDRSVHYGPFDCTAPGGEPHKDIGSCC
ncbi:MAG: methyltransferase domain-containing protein [Rhodothalassiaceae bacterium]